MHKVNVFLTVDTEHSIGGAFQNPALKPVGSNRRVFCHFNKKTYGIPLIMDIADRFGLRMTFFVEALSSLYFGIQETRKICESILDRRHEVQLHVHPNFLNFSLPEPRTKKHSDTIGVYSLNRQIEILGDAKERLENCGVKPVTAFRAGNYGANMDTLKALKSIGIFVDCSYNQACVGTSCLLPDLQVNDLYLLDDVHELPVTNFTEYFMHYNGRMKYLDMNGVSASQTIHLLAQAAENGPGHITLVMHSFSFIKSFDAQYTRVRVRHFLIKEFEAICRFLAENSQIFHVMCVGQLKDTPGAKSFSSRSHVFPRVPVQKSLRNKLFQVFDNLM